MQKLIFDVCGEFGYEILAVAPLVNWYKNNNHEVKVLTSVGSKYLYPECEVEEVYRQRIPFLQLKINGKIVYNQHHHIGDMWYKPLIGNKMFWEDKWLPPNIKDHYKVKYKLTLDKPLLIISNKFQSEWSGPPVNYISIEVLKDLFEKLQARYTIVYNRPFVEDISNDNSTQLPFDDKALCKEFGIAMLQDYMTAYGLDYNETQVALYSNTDNFISTQGGNSAYAALFGGTNLIYGIRGNEFKSNAYETWFKLLSNQEIHTCNSLSELPSMVETVFN